MTQSKTKSVMYWKQASNGLIAHVYEHIASSYITDYLVQNELYFIADFDHWAKTYGSMMYIDFNLHTPETARILQKAISRFNKSAISAQQIYRAAEQIALEYERPLMEFEEPFVKEVQAVHAQPWVDMSQLTAHQADEKTSVDTVFSAVGIRYGRKSSQSVKKQTLHFEINKDLYTENPAMKALAVLITQAVALNLHKALENTYVYYDAGDEWDWGSATVAYRTNLRFTKKSKLDTQELQEITSEYVQLIANSSFSRHLERLINSSYKNETNRYFSLESMNEITDGIIIGYAGWKTVANRATIQRLLKNVTVEVLVS